SEGAVRFFKGEVSTALSSLNLACNGIGDEVDGDLVANPLFYPDDIPYDERGYPLYLGHAEPLAYLRSPLWHRFMSSPLFSRLAMLNLTGNRISCLKDLTYSPVDLPLMLNLRHNPYDRGDAYKWWYDLRNAQKRPVKTAPDPPANAWHGDPLRRVNG